MDLKQLRTFVEVSETGSLGRASDKLRIAQSALSRQIALMEAELGFELFVRHGRGMRLTEAGEKLAARMKGLLQELENAIEDARSQGGVIRGQVSIGLMPTTSVILARRLAMRVTQELPALRLRIVEGYAGHLVDWVQRGEIDMTLLYGPETDYHLLTTPLLYEELVVVGKAQSALRPGHPISMADLAKLPLVAPSRPHGLRLLVESAADKRGLELNISIEADSYRVILDLVEAGVGYAVLPPSSLQSELRNGALIQCPIEGAPIRREIILACQPIRSEAKAIRAVTDLLVDEVARMVADGSWPAYPASPLRNRGRLGI